jgi:BirA family biotin operon repressor/biotin-[acetyl-CoA-carboxylase] ligase
MFNIENFDIKLETRTIGRNFIYSESIDSTNSFLLENKQNLANGTVIFTEFQESGRGRFKRPWESNKGENLTFSILLRKKYLLLNPNHINLASSLAVSSAIENLYQLKTDLKWPNDILIKNKKVSGILLESSSKGSELEKIVVGIGVNVNQTKFDCDFKIQPTSVKFEMRKEANRERFLSEILNGFEELLSSLQDSPKKVLDEWRERCRMIGEPITIDTGTERKYGVFYDIDANGFMLLKSGEEIEKITNGDVSAREKN